MTTKPPLTIKNAARLLGQSVQTTYRWIHRGYLPAIPWGERFLRIPADAIEKTLKYGIAPKSEYNLTVTKKARRPPRIGKDAPWER
jgi:excisionase family DNA binding protein